MNERDIFLAALEQPTAEARTEYLGLACAGDPTLQQRVEDLLQMHEKTGEFLQKPLVERLVEGVAVLEDAAQSARDPSATARGRDGLGFLSPSDQPGSLGRLGHYEVQEVIGSGGMGIVLRAFDERLHRVVAIKVMAAPLAASAASRKRFQREARAAAAVCHDHIVTIHAVEESGDLPYLVMQCVSGLSLQQRIDRDGPLEVHEILRIGMQTAAGLAAAHAQGLIHRDIKPANILLENGVERVRITDFGLARAAADASISQSGAVIGTPQYMAPEQARGEALDGRTDLFSLGSVLYAMCTGRAPFRATNSIAVLKRVCEEAPSPVREANADIPDWLVALIDKLQAKNPDDRYQTAAEVAELLGQRLAQLQNSTALSPAVLLASGGRKPPDSAARHKRRWAVAAALLLGLAATFGLAEGTGATKFTATVIRLLTPEGTLVVEMTDPQVKVTIDGDGGLVITGVGQHEVRLKLGSHTLQADKNGKPVPLDQELVTITRDDKPVVRVRLEGAAPSQAAAIGEKDAPPSAVAPFDAATAKEHQEAWAKHLGVPIELTNSIGMKFRLIPPGEFEMGSTSQDIEAARAAEKYSDDQAVSDALTSEGPIHQVVLSEPFYLSVTEVTQEDFETVTGENPSTFRPGGANADKVKDSETSQLPVQGTSWNDAAHFCSRLSSREGLASNYRLVGTAVEMLPGNGYRLPREAQWEFACRGGTTTRFWFGDQPADHANREWLRANSDGRPHPVGSLAKNPFGLFDMHGNVSEWCQDGWNPEFYLLSRDRPAVDPLSKPKGPHQHMVRGGAWTSEPAVRGRSAFRVPAVPSKQYESNGLRVVLTVDSARRVIERSAQGAFVVLDGQGVEVRKFDTLADAVQSASDGDTIEIRGNGPFVSKPISIGRTALTIRAGAGFRPVIKPSSEGITKAPFLTTDAALVLEGLDFHAMFPREDQKYPGGSIQSKNASLRAANCRFRPGIWMTQPPVCEFRNCEFLNGGWWGCCGQQISSGARVLFENCLFWSGGHAIHLFYAIDATDDVSIQITRSTFTSWSAPLALSLNCPRPAGMDGPNALKPIRLEVSRSIFDSAGILAFGQQQGFTDKAGVLPPGEADAMLLRLLEWRGEWNLFPAGSNSVHWYTNFKAQPPRGPKGLDEWKKFSGSKEVDSRDGRPRFHGGSLLARANLDQLTPEDFRLRPDSPGYRAGPDGKDLGADVDLVGPGPAYERWKKTPEYQQWLQETGKVKP